MILTEDDVKRLVAPIFEKYKRASFHNKKFTNYKERLKAYPDFYPGYKLAIEYAERIKVHSEIGDFPEQLFAAHSPNQTEKEYDYMRANFKQNTLPVFVDYDATNKRCFNDGNWNIYYHTDDDQFIQPSFTYEYYLEHGIRDFGSLEDYVKFYLATQKSVDANGVVAVKPLSIPTIEDESGELYIDDSQLLEPQPVFYSSKQVLSDSKFDSQYFILESHEKSEVVFSTKKEQMGYIVEIYDEENIWRIEQVGKYTDFTYDIQIYFTHGEGVVPASRLQGIPQMIGNSIVWQSPFLYACDLLDYALMNKNYLQCSIATVNFPYRVALGRKCAFEFKSGDGGMVNKCMDGKIYGDGGSLIDCPSCHGSGIRDRFSQVGGTMLLYPADMMGEGESKMTVEPLKFVGPETDPLRFTNEIIDQDINRAYDVIHVKRNSQANGTGIAGDGTATSSILDLKTMYASIKIFSDQIFGKYEFIANRIGWQRYGQAFNPPVISFPVSFDFNTEADYLQQITQAQNAKLAPPVIQNLIMKYLNTLYYNEVQSRRIFDLIIATDRLLVLSQDDALAKQRVGLAEKWEIILHDSSFQFIDELMDEFASTEICADDDCSKGFFALDFDEQKDLLIKKAQVKATAIANGSQGNGILPITNASVGLLPAPASIPVN